MERKELYHAGVKGMRWGIRRYQNKDGSLTDAGKRRYARDAREKGWTMGDDGVARSGGKKNRKEERADTNRWAREDLERSKTLTNETANLARNVKTMNDKAIKNKPKPTMDLSNMTEQEMRAQINRRLLEQQYTNMFAPETTSKGRERVGKILEVAADTLAVTGSALAVAISIKTLLGK